MKPDLPSWQASAILMLVAVTLMVLLSSCAWAPPPSACPPLKDYSQEFNEAIAGQLSALPMPDNWAIVEAIGDYRVLRAMTRECE